jgi:MFS family permease
LMAWVLAFGSDGVGMDGAGLGRRGWRFVLRVWGHRPGAVSLAYPVLLAVGAVDAAGYSVIGPVLPELAVAHQAGVAAMGAVAAAFPLAMIVGFAAAAPLVLTGRIRSTLLVALAVSGLGTLMLAAEPALPGVFAGRALMGLGSGGLWIGVTFATLAYWPGQEYLCAPGSSLARSSVVESAPDRCRVDVVAAAAAAPGRGAGTSVGRKLRGDTPFTVGEAYILAIFLGTRLQDVLTIVETRLHDDESVRG